MKKKKEKEKSEKEGGGGGRGRRRIRGCTKSKNEKLKRAKEHHSA